MSVWDSSDNSTTGTTGVTAAEGFFLFPCNGKMILFSIVKYFIFNLKYEFIKYELLIAFLNGRLSWVSFGGFDGVLSILTVRVPPGIGVDEAMKLVSKRSVFFARGPDGTALAGGDAFLARLGGADDDREHGAPLGSGTSRNFCC